MTDSGYGEIDAVFRQARRTVWIVTSAADGRRGGLAATWVSQASIDSRSPAAVIAIAGNHFTAELIDRSGHFALHLITADQIEHAWNFGLGSGRDRDKFSGLATTTAKTGAPILKDCLSWLDCRVFARLEGGDRIYYWADVVAGQRTADGVSLDDRQLLAAASEGQRDQLLAGLAADIEVQRPLRQQWRDNLPHALRPLHHRAGGHRPDA